MPKMQALRYDDSEQGLYLSCDQTKPVPKSGEALIRILRAGICSTVGFCVFNTDLNSGHATAADKQAQSGVHRVQLKLSVSVQDLEIIKGYVPGYKSSLGHEFVGVVESCDDSKWQGKKVVGEINCLCEAYQHSDPVMVRNHAPNRVVLGKINKDGCMAEYITLPKENLYLVSSDLSDQEACFAEPLAAACRIAEQQVSKLPCLTVQLAVTMSHVVQHDIICAIDFTPN